MADKTFELSLDEIQPSQLYLCREKLDNVSEITALPVKRLNERTVLTDGHCRAFIQFQNGSEEIEVYEDEDELDWNAYRICVDWCISENIRTISDLKDRILDLENYEKLWIERCRKLHNAE